MTVPTEREQSRLAALVTRHGWEAVGVAVHEAGHAVTAARLGWRFGAVTVRPDATTLGRLVLQPANPPRSPREHAIVDVAGGLGEALAGFAADDPAPTLGGMVRDLRDLQARTLALRREYAGGLDLAPDAPAAFREAHRILRESWPAVLAITEALLTRQTLPGPEAVRIIRAALGTSNAPTAPRRKRRRSPWSVVARIDLGDGQRLVLRRRRRRKAI